MDRKLTSYGPSIVVLLTVAIVILAGPAAVKRLTYVKTQHQIQLASERLQQGDNVLEAVNQAHRDIAMKVEPSVVYISTERDVNDPRLPREVMQLSSGSGWVYDEFGHIVTNAHVIDGAERIEVQLYNGALKRAVRVGTDPRTDIAVLRIEAGELHPADRSAEPVQQGDVVFALGSPFDFRFSISQGIVSGEGRQAQLDTIHYQNFIQVDAAINPGNSGGPLVNIYGQVVGMNTAIATGRPGSLNDGVFSGIGLAIPMSMIESVVPQLIEKGEVTRGFLGVELFEDLSRGKARTLGFNGEGVEVRAVHPDGPAERAGVAPGDVITAVDGRSVATLKQMQSRISSHFPGEKLTLDIWRYDPVTDSADTFRLDVSLARLRPEQMVDPTVLRFLFRLGFVKLETATEERTATMGVPQRRGVLVEQVNEGSSISDMLPPGTIITHIYDDPVQNLDEFYSRLERALLAYPNGVQVRYVRPDGSEGIVDLRR